MKTIDSIEICENTNNEKCPHCNSKDLEYDLVEEDNGSKHDVIDCSSCGKRIYYED